jgi:2-oxoglutarate ferredoxin oxidoreductase subunit alpha
MQELQKEGLKVGHAHFRHIMPLPRNTKEIFGRYKRLLVCELNSGQFVNYLRMTFPQFAYLQYNRIYGKPFFVSELTEHVHKILSE